MLSHAPPVYSVQQDLQRGRRSASKSCSSGSNFLGTTCQNCWIHLNPFTGGYCTSHHLGVPSFTSFFCHKPQLTGALYHMSLICKHNLSSMYWAKRHQRPIQLFQLFPHLSAQTSIKILQITLSTLRFDILGRAVDRVTGTDFFGTLPVFSCLSQLAFNGPRSKDVQPLLSWVVLTCFNHIPNLVVCKISIWYVYVQSICSYVSANILCTSSTMYMFNWMRIHVPARFVINPCGPRSSWPNKTLHLA